MHLILELKETTAMGISKPFAVVLLCCLLVMSTATPAELVEPAQDGAISTYIVHVASSHSPRATRNAARLTGAYTSFLRENLPKDIREPAPSILYSYAHAMTGFAARLTARQAAHLEAQPSVLAVTIDRLSELHTTYSSAFLGLTPVEDSPLMRLSKSVSDVVIGVLDTGIYPKDRASFGADPSMKPPPRSFRGGCVSTPDFNATEYCNNKLVGAKFFHKGFRAMTSHVSGSAPASGSPLDYDGHGTHCASTAAGAPVSDASLFSYGLGVARGTASGARIASYNVCGGGCTLTDIVAGIDEAIRDKVNVLSMSIGVGSLPTLYHDPLSIAMFRAVREGIFVSTSAGNEGPRRETVGNVAPWVLTVGASSMSRGFFAPINLGNGISFMGYSLYSGQDAYVEMKPLVYGGDVGSARCQAGKLDPNKVTGKFVLCDADGSGVAQGYAVKQAGGVAAIISSTSVDGEYARAQPHLLPAVSVRYADAMEIRNYSRTPNPTAEIPFFGSFARIRNPHAPRVATFSSRGPSLHTPEILKPDIIAPGVEILAAWTGEASPSELDIDTRRVQFNIISGTSMAAAHVSGIAALLKVARPNWSPAAIKSAMMTTANRLDNDDDPITDMSTGKKAGPFEMGAGHVHPNNALEPGMVYDAGEDDYISFLCALGYTPRQIAIFTGGGTKEDICLEHKNITVGDHNYPAFSVAFKSYEEKVTLRRVVRNVGLDIDVDPVYTSHLRPYPSSVTIAVHPEKLVFDAQHQTLEYTVTFSLVLPAAIDNSTSEVHSSLLWTNGYHKVVSPIVITLPPPTVVVATM